MCIDNTVFRKNMFSRDNFENTFPSLRAHKPGGLQAQCHIRLDCFSLGQQREKRIAAGDESAMLVFPATSDTEKKP